MMLHKKNSVRPKFFDFLAQLSRLNVIYSNRTKSVCFLATCKCKLYKMFCVNVPTTLFIIVTHKTPQYSITDCTDRHFNYGAI